VWEQVAYKGVPKEKRHVKSTYSNATPATDGQIVVAFFGSQGLYAYDRTPLNAVVESADDSSPYWRKEKVSFDAAYGNEKVAARLAHPISAQ